MQRILKKKVEDLLQCIIHEREFDDGKYDKAALKYYKPMRLSGEKSIEIDYEKQYEAMKLIIAQKANIDPQKLTVLQFYTYSDIIKKQSEAEQKALRKTKKH